MIGAKELKELSAGLSIVYAEDEEMLRENLHETLLKLFQTVYVASNGQEAFELFKKHQIDIVLTDINMPIMNGIELIRSIHEYSEYQPMIVVASAHNEPRLLTALINMGIDQFLNKPIDKQYMINSLHKVCKIISDRKMLLQYEEQLQGELDTMERKNKVLEQKVNQLAYQTNKNIAKKQKIVQEKAEENYYETLLRDDKDELKELSEELENFIAMMFQGESLNEVYLYRLSNVYKKYSSVLNTYTEFYDISSVIYEFSQVMLSYQEKFLEDIGQTGIYFESLQLTLEKYRENIWNKEANNPRFYNASLKNDIELIIRFLENTEVENNEIEFF